MDTAERYFHVVNADGYINTAYITRERADQRVALLREHSPEQAFRAVATDGRPGDPIPARVAVPEH